MQKVKIASGDVIRMPLDEGMIGYGQVAAVKGKSAKAFYLAVFNNLYDARDDPDLRQVVEDRIVFFAQTLDALLYHDRWQIVGNVGARSGGFPWPAYVVSVAPGKYAVVDHTGKIRRLATHEEREQLTNEITVAPIRLQKALRAYHGLEPWDEVYDELRPVPEWRLAMNLIEGD